MANKRARQNNVQQGIIYIPYVEMCLICEMLNNICIQNLNSGSALHAADRSFAFYADNLITTANYIEMNKPIGKRMLFNIFSVYNIQCFVYRMSYVLCVVQKVYLETEPKFVISYLRILYIRNKVNLLYKLCIDQARKQVQSRGNRYDCWIRDVSLSTPSMVHI